MTIKGYVLDALQKFWNKLRTTYVTDCETDANDLALAASQGKALGDRVATVESKTSNLSAAGQESYLTGGLNTGGTITANNTSGGCDVRAWSSARRISMFASADGLCGLYDNTNNNQILRSGTDQQVMVPHPFFAQTSSLINPNSAVLPPIFSSTGTSKDGIYYMSSSSAALWINAQWQSSSGSISARGIAIPASDRRLKENIEPNTKSGLALINALDVKQFDWKDGHGHWDYGIIAQEARELDLNLVVGEEKEDSYLSIDTLYLADTLVKAVQELTVEVEKLKVEVEYLKANK